MINTKRCHPQLQQQKQQNCLFFYSCILLFIPLSCCGDTNTTTLRTCPRPLPPPNAKIIGLKAYRKYPGRNQPAFHGVEKYHEYDEVSFTCNEGYIRTGVILPYFNKMFMTCGSNGKWFPDTENLGHCVLAKSIAVDKCNVTEDLFKCKSNGKCISKEKRCDCNIDCDDASDEMNCKVRRKVIFATPRLHSTGIISSPGYPRIPHYPKEYNCVYHVYTLQDHHIQVDFEEFDLPKKENNKCVDFVKILSIHPKFLQKRNKKLLRKKYRTKKLRYSQTKCGSNMFRRIYSNASHITINVSLGYVKPHLRNHKGFSLSWQVQNQEGFHAALQRESMERHDKTSDGTEEQQDSDNDEDTMYTLVLPIALGGLLPMTLVLLCLCYRIVKHHFKMKNSQNNEKGGKITNNDSLTMTLTENNLARFDEQNRYPSVTPDNEGNIALLTTTANVDANKFPSDGEGIWNENVSNNDKNRHHTPSCCRDNSSRLNNNHQTKESVGSRSPQQPSDVPRYIMSYDMPLRQSPSMHTRQTNHSSFHRLSSTYSHSRSNSPRSNPYSRNSSPCFSTHPQQQQQQLQHQQQQQHQQQLHQHNTRASQHSRYSRENMPPSSCSSQSTNTCSLCHKKRSACNSERLQRMYFQEQSFPTVTAPLHPLSVNTTADQLYPVNYCDYGDTSIDQHSYSPNSGTYMHSPYPTCTIPSVGHSEKDFYNNIDPYPFMSSYPSDDHLPYINHNTVPYPLNYSDSDFIAESALMQQPLHRVEKHKVIYLEEMASEEIYGPYPDRTRGGSLICTH